MTEEQIKKLVEDSVEMGTVMENPGKDNEYLAYVIFIREKHKYCTLLCDIDIIHITSDKKELIEFLISEVKAVLDNWDR